MQGVVASEDEKINQQRTSKSQQLVLFKWLDKRAKYHPNSDNMAFFPEKLPKLPSAWGLSPQIPSVKRRQILALGSNPSPLL